MGMQKSDFKKLSLPEKLEVLRKIGKYLATRQFTSYNVHLYLVNNFFAEAWMKISFNELAWIELTTEELVSQNYLNSEDLLDELDL